VQRRFRDKVTIALESHVARLQASIATIAHHERPDYLDRLAMLRDQVFVLDHMYMSVFATCGWILRLGVTVALLASIHPALALFGAAYVGAVVFVSSGLHAPAADVLLLLAAGSRLSAYVGGTVGELGFLRGFWIYGSRRLAWLEDYAASLIRSADLPVPAALGRGIRLVHAALAYPGTSRLVLDGLSVLLPAG